MRAWRPSRQHIVRQAICLVVALFIFVLSFAGSSLAQQTDIDVIIGVGDTTLRMEGDTSPNALVTFLDGGVVTGTTTSDVLGQYSQLFTAQTPGIHELSVYSRDTDNRVTDTVTVSVNIQEHAETVVDLFLPPTIGLGQLEVNKGEALPLRGQASPGTTIVIHVDDFIVTTLADATGGWQHSLDTANLQAGQHTLRALAQKSGGLQSHSTENRTFMVIAPDAGGVLPPGAIPGAPTGRPDEPVFTHPKHGDVIDSDRVVARGTAEPDTQIEIYNRGQLVGSVFAGTDGKWSLTVMLKEYLNELRARACRGTLCSALTSPLTVYRKGPASGLFIKLDRYRFSTSVHDPINIILNVSSDHKPFKVTIDWGDGKRDKLTSAEFKSLLKHTYKTQGKFNGRVFVEDESRATAEVQFSVEVHPREASWPSWAIPILVLTIALIIALLMWKILSRKHNED